ncbi:MAG: hypothetical protein AVDCRST_MAG93-7494 [uncultured Chloroflexia bacterium]|uniref:Uncharacterized protein n=1 Tax=uncultured Chloroflexia bacterium TaxID=1672391 RepID=A0A6J4MEZ1_9CHLR|nr:MAG: hypothetical protein AVDCRST_MAG93-7494 [uncultured Chloroflexia bacterium]
MRDMSGLRCTNGSFVTNIAIRLELDRCICKFTHEMRNADFRAK